MTKGAGLFFFTLIVLIVGLDQATKYWIVEHFTLYESRVIIPDLFNLTYLTNNGAAFSILAGQAALWRQLFFIGATCAALVFIWIAHRSFSQTSRLYSIALGLIAGGAIGNLIDRIRFAYVVDFLDFFVDQYHWPAFNVADAAITLGVSLFIVKNLFFDRQSI
jgi:signal peptidase II